MDGISWYSVTKWGRNWCGLPDHSVLVPYIGDFRKYQQPPKNSGPKKQQRASRTPCSSPQNLIKISHFHHLIVHNTHLIINKDRLHGFSLPLLLLLHSQLMYLVHIWIVLLHDLELYLLPYFPFLSFSFEDLPSHDDHTLHRLV